MVRNSQQGVIDHRSLRLIHAFLGIAFLMGGAILLSDSFETVQADDLSSLLLMVCGEIELLAGLWLLLGVYADRTNLWLLTAMIGIWISSVYQVFMGKSSSVWFGSLSINPWLILLLSLAALALLARWQHSRSRDQVSSASLTMAGLGTTAFLVALAGITLQPLVVLAGTANLRGYPVKETPLKFRGNSIEIEVRTDEKGYFRLPPIRPGQYTVSMVKSPAPAEPGTNPPNPGHNSKAARTSRDRSTKSKRAKAPQKPQSETAKMFADTEIIVLDPLDSSTKSLVVDFE